MGVRRPRGARTRILVIGVAFLACVEGSGGEEVQVFEIADRGRLSLVESDLDRGAPVAFHVVLEDGGAEPTRTARVVTEDGRRLETRVERVAGTESTFGLELDGAFLRPGRYLIEVDIEGVHSLNLRRYVVLITGERSTPAR